MMRLPRRVSRPMDPAIFLSDLPIVLDLAVRLFLPREPRQLLALIPDKDRLLHLVGQISSSHIVEPNFPVPPDRAWHQSLSVNTVWQDRAVSDPKEFLPPEYTRRV